MHARSPHSSPRELVDQLVAIGASLKSFNDLHAGGRESGLLLSELIHRGTPQEVATLTQAIPAAGCSNYVTEASTLAKQHAGILRQCGLELRVDDGLAQAREIIHDYAIAHDTLGVDLERVTIHVAELAISDFAQFTDFLNRLRDLRPPIIPLGGTLGVFSAIGDSLAAALERFDFRKKLEYVDEEASTAIDGTQNLVELFHDLGLNTVGDYLSEIVHHAARGDLSDYLRAKRYNLLPNSYNGPESWHNELTAEAFKDRWRMALTVSRDLTSGGDMGLSTRVHDHLAAMARKAYREIRFELNTARPDAHYKQHGPEMLRVLAKALEALPFR
jgi:hypothetical protein